MNPYESPQTVERVPTFWETMIAELCWAGVVASVGSLFTLVVLSAGR